MALMQAGRYVLGDVQSIYGWFCADIAVKFSNDEHQRQLIPTATVACLDHDLRKSGSPSSEN